MSGTELDTLINTNQACFHTKAANSHSNPPLRNRGAGNPASISQLEGVTAVVDLQAGTAAVTMTTEISDEILTKAVVDAGYEVTSVA